MCFAFFSASSLSEHETTLSLLFIGRYNTCRLISDPLKYFPLFRCHILKVFNLTRLNCHPKRINNQTIATRPWGYYSKRTHFGRIIPPLIKCLLRRHDFSLSANLTYMYSRILLFSTIIITCYKNTLHLYSSFGCDAPPWQDIPPVLPR